jgi:hypothetical protein
LLFAEHMSSRSVGPSQCTAETLVRLKHETKTSLSYAALRKRAIWLGYADESLPSAGWRDLEERLGLGYDPAWGVNDTHPTGHGTPMSGLALFGDLTSVLAGSVPVVLSHRLESVKMVHPSVANKPELYGDITRESMARAELAAPHRKRVFSMQVTSRNTRARGRPSSWSAAVDQLSSGAGEPAGSQRLVLVSSGNVHLDRAADYPSNNETDQVHDPGQAWNAVTVGACTEMVGVDQTRWPGWQPLAPPGALCPASTTSLVWEEQWPV